MAIPRPLILDNADLMIGDGATPTENLRSVACTLNHIELNPDVSTVTLTTMCGEQDYPGSVKWTLSATLYQSFDLDATEDVLSTAVDSGVPVSFELTPRRDEPVSATNPMWSGMLVPQPYSPINGDAGAESTVDIEWSLTAPPTKTIVPGAVTAAAGAD